MNSAILSSKFQICIPKEIREELHLEAGQEFLFITKGRVIHLVPKLALNELRGLMTGTNTQNIRDRKDRL